MKDLIKLVESKDLDIRGLREYQPPINTPYERKYIETIKSEFVKKVQTTQVINKPILF